MKIAPIADVKARFSEYVKQSVDGPIVVTKNGHATAMLISISSDDELEDYIIALSPKLKTILTKARERVDSGKKIPHKDFWKKVKRGGRNGT